MKILCKNCQWFVPYNEENKPRGTCHRFPPTNDSNPDWFPVVDGDFCWCGEFKPVETEKSNP